MAVANSYQLCRSLCQHTRPAMMQLSYALLATDRVCRAADLKQALDCGEITDMAAAATGAVPCLALKDALCKERWPGAGPRP